MPGGVIILAMLAAVIVLSGMIWAACALAGQADDASDDLTRQLTNADDPRLTESARIPASAAGDDCTGGRGKSRGTIRRLNTLSHGGEGV